MAYYSSPFLHPPPFEADHEQGAGITGYQSIQAPTFPAYSLGAVPPLGEISPILKDNTKVNSIQALATLPLSGVAEIWSPVGLGRNDKKSICNFQGCQKAFSRVSDLQRHVKTIHLKSELFWCPVAECSRSLGGKQPFPRKDKRLDHLLKVHRGVIIDLQAFDTQVGKVMAENGPMGTINDTPLTDDNLGHNVFPIWSWESPPANTPNFEVQGTLGSDEPMPDSDPMSAEIMAHGALHNTSDPTFPSNWMDFSSSYPNDALTDMTMSMEFGSGLDSFAYNPMYAMANGSIHNMALSFSGNQVLSENGNGISDSNGGLSLDQWSDPFPAFTRFGYGSGGFDEGSFVPSIPSGNQVGLDIGAGDGDDISNDLFGNAMRTVSSGDVEDWSWLDVEISQ